LWIVKIITTTNRRVLSRDWGDHDGDTKDREDDGRYVEAMWAFALEENGDYARAAAVAREVLKEDPTGAFVCVVVLYARRCLVHTQNPPPPCQT
jgi:hypothetical protein